MIHTTSANVNELPHWDLSNLFPGFDSPEFEAAFNKVIVDVQDFLAYMDANGIDRLLDEPALDDELVATAESLINRYNQLQDDVLAVQVYMYSFLSTDSRNTAVQAKFSILQQSLAKLSLIGTRFTAWVGSIDVEGLLQRSALAAEHAFALRQAKIQAQHLMSPVEEALASELSLTGRSAWNKMFNNVTSQLTVVVEIDGKEQTLPLPAAQNLYYNPDRAVRQQAYEAINKALQSVTEPMAMALNSIKGETLTLSRRRGWETPLDAVLQENVMDRKTLDAMMAATRNAYPDFQRYLKARAKALGLPVLTGYDRLVPLGEGEQQWSWQDARQFILDQFGTYSDKMRRMAERAFDEKWIDAEPRDGKRGGAFCMTMPKGDSRILCNFEPGFTSVGTLAHELGHAYHNVNLGQRSAINRNTPMTLAETASTFCQKIVENAALKTAVPADQLIILDGGLEYATRVLLGASSDFYFEQAVFEKRRERELSADEFVELQLKFQRESTGDAVDPDTLVPYRWVYVPHYYAMSYYNFPYIFGLLFGLGLYARYQEDVDAFRKGYDELLSSTGMGTAAELAGKFGIDLSQPAFWEASLDVLRADVARFEQLVNEM
ncbi:MAG: M3 family oligoendopeptidase [Candidatus Promineifilaceae bacterium]